MSASSRWDGIERPVRPGNRCRACEGASAIEHTLATRGAKRLWELLHTEDYVPALGALTGNRRCSRSRAGLEGDLLSRLAGRGRREHRRARCIRTRASTRPTACRRVVRRINRALLRADQIEHAEGKRGASTGSRRSWPTPRPASAARSTPTS